MSSAHHIDIWCAWHIVSSKYTYLIQLTKMSCSRDILSCERQVISCARALADPEKGFWGYDPPPFDIWKIEKKYNETKLNIQTYFRHMLGILVFRGFFKLKIVLQRLKEVVHAYEMK